MNPSNFLWAAGFVANCALCFVLLKKGRVRSFPIFTSYVAFEILITIILFLVGRFLGQRTYYNTYWSAVVPDNILQVAVLCEICRNVINPYRRSLPKRGLYMLAALVILGTAVSIFLATSVSLTTLQNSYGTILRLNLGMSLVRCAIFAAITLFADALGLSWRHHVQQLATGLAIYSLSDLAVNSIFLFVQPYTVADRALGYVSSLSYLVAVGVWTFGFFLNEPVRGTLSPAAEIFISNLHRRFSLGRRTI